MCKRRYLIVIILLSCIFAKNTFAADSGSINLNLGGHRVEQGIRVIEKNKIRYINLPFLTDYFHMVADWDPEHGEIFLKFGNLGIKMFENTTRYTVNGGKRRLSAAPFERDGELWFPVEFILRLGLVVKSQDRANLSFNWAHNYLLAIENIQYQGRPAFLLAGTKELKLLTSSLTDPDRLVIELPGFKAHFALESKINKNSEVKRVRVKQLDSDHLQLVFDLNETTGYKIIQDPAHPSQAIVIFNYLISGVNFVNDTEEKIEVKTSFPAEYEVAPSNEPNRMTVDFKGATLGVRGDLNVSDAKWIGAAHLSQVDPQTVRMVLDLLLPEPGFVFRSNNPNRVEIKRFQNINRVEWLDTGKGGKLRIGSNGEIAESVRQLSDPGRLRLDLNYAQLAPDVKVPELRNDQVKGINISAIDQTAVRIEVALNGYVGYTIETSPDRHFITVNFSRSPLAGKTIILDAGHGGVDLGACGRQGTFEKNINLEVSLRLKDLLEEAGAAVVLTRSDDGYVSLYERSFTANYLFGDLFISVHTNNHPDLSVHGIEVYYYKDRDFAMLLAESVLAKMGQFTGFNKLGAKVQDFVVIRESQMPGILIELGYLSNFQEEATIKTAEFKEDAAMGIFQGVMDYFYAGE